MDTKFSCGFREKKFRVDLLSLREWMAANVPGFSELYYGPGYQVLTDGKLTPEQQQAIQAHLDSLTELGEAEKSALPSRATGYEKQVIVNAINGRLVTKTWDQMSEVERKFLRNMDLTASEFDALAAG